MKKIGIALFAFLLLLSCEENKDTSLRVAMLLWPPYEYYFLAENMGFYDGYSIEFVEYSTPSAAIRAYQTGLVDAIIVTDHLYLRMYSEDKKDVIIQIIDYSAGSDVVMAREDIKTTDDIIGKNIGAESSALGLYVMHSFLDYMSVEIEQIKYVPIDVANTPRAFSEGTIDIAVTYEPFATQIAKTGGVKIFDSKKIPYEISDILISYPELIEKKSESFIVLLTGFYKALELFKNDPNRYADVLGERESLTGDEFISAIEGVKVLNHMENKSLFNKSSEINIFSTLEYVNKKMINYGIIDKILNTSIMVDTSIISKVKNE